MSKIITITITDNDSDSQVRGLAFETKDDNENFNIISLLHLFRSVIHEMWNDLYRVDITPRK